MNKLQRITLVAVSLCGASGLVTPPSVAQGPKWGAAAGATYTTYQFDVPESTGIKTLSLLVIPFGTRISVAGRATVSLSGSYAQGVLAQEDGSESTLEGLTDSQFRVDVPIARDLVTITGLVQLPTGRSDLMPEELGVAGAVADNLFPFRISNWGAGGAIGVLTQISHAFGPTRLNLGVGYVGAREYEATADELATYRPGSQFQADAVLARTLGTASSLTVQLGMQRYTDDQLEGRNHYRSGDRYHATGSYAFTVGAGSAGIVYAGVLHRTGGSFELPSIDGDAAEDLLLAGTGIRVPIGRSTLVPSADVRLLRAHDGLGQGYLTGFGSSLEIPLGRSVLIPSARAQLGRVVIQNGFESGVTGLDFGLMMRIGGDQR